MTKYIRCITDGGGDIGITKDKIYKVISENYKFYIINSNNLSEKSYFKYRFEEVNEQGMTKYVKCVENRLIESIVTLDKIYKVVAESELYYSIICNDGVVRKYYQNRFEDVDGYIPNQTKPVYKFIPNSELIPAIVNGVDGVLIK